MGRHNGNEGQKIIVWSVKLGGSERERESELQFIVWTHHRVQHSKPYSLMDVISFFTKLQAVHSKLYMLNLS